MPIGSRVFLLRQGREPRGIIGSGYTTTDVFQEGHWDEDIANRGGETNYVKFEYDHLLRNDEGPLPVREIGIPELRRVNWSTQSSGIKMAADAALVLEQLWAQFIGREWLGYDAGAAEAFEGEVHRYMTLHRRREAKLRAAKLAQARTEGGGRLRCEVPGCGFDFEEVYGPVGEGYAQVHHTRPLHLYEEPSITRLEDLLVVCANCHVMIHHGGECREVETLLAQ